MGYTLTYSQGVYLLENPVFMTSEIPGFSEPKLDKPCISEFRKTKSEKPGIYTAEKRSISESEKPGFSVFHDHNLQQKFLISARKIWFF